MYNVDSYQEGGMHVVMQISVCMVWDVHYTKKLRILNIRNVFCVVYTIMQISISSYWYSELS